MSFHNSPTPEDLPASHQGEPWPEDVSEAADEAVTDWFGGRQPVLEPMDALLGGRNESE